MFLNIGVIGWSFWTRRLAHALGGCVVDTVIVEKTAERFDRQDNGLEAGTGVFQFAMKLSPQLVINIDIIWAIPLLKLLEIATV